MDQHFLRDAEVINRMLHYAEIHPNDTVVDIGAGDGAIASRIPKCKMATAVEIDPALIPVLRRLPHVAVVEGDALKLPIAADKIVSNVPFSIAEPLLYKLFRTVFKKAVLLVPRSFATKVMEKDALLGLYANAFFMIEHKEDVDPEALEPVPDTHVCVIVLTPKEPTTEEYFTRQLFLQRDKKVKNALRETYVRLKKATKRQGDEFVDSLQLPAYLLDKDVPQMKIDEYQKIIEAIHEKATP